MGTVETGRTNQGPFTYILTSEKTFRVTDVVGDSNINKLLARAQYLNTVVSWRERLVIHHIFLANNVNEHF